MFKFISQGATFLIAIFILQANLLAVESGVPLRSEKYGQLGAGDLRNFAVGFVAENGVERVFVSSSGCSMNKNNLFLYEKIGEADDGAPLFEKVSRIGTPFGEVDGNTRIVKSRDGNIYGFFRTKDGFVRSKFDAENGKFVPFGKVLNIAWSCGFVENADSSWFVYYPIRTVLRKAELRGLKRGIQRNPTCLSTEL